MRHYINTVTKGEIFTECEINGGDWVEVKAPEPKKPQEPVKKPIKRTKC